MGTTLSRNQKISVYGDREAFDTLLLNSFKIVGYGMKLDVLGGKHLQSCFVTSSESERPDSS